MKEKHEFSGGAMGAGLVGSMVGQQIIGGGAAHVIMSSPEEIMSDGELSRLKELSGAKQKIIFEEHSMPAYESRLASGKEHDIIRVGPDGRFRQASIVAHELGHASSPMLKHKAGLVAYSGGLLGTLGDTVYAAKLGAEGKELSKTHKLVSAGITAPVIIEETRANAKALQTLHRFGGRKAVLAGLPVILGSETSYLSLGALPTAANYIARKTHGFLNPETKKIHIQRG